MDNQKIIEMLKEAGIESGEPIKIELNPIHTKAVEEFIRNIEEAHERAKNSKLRFDYLRLSNFYKLA